MTLNTGSAFKQTLFLNGKLVTIFTWKNKNSLIKLSFRITEFKVSVNSSF